MPFSLMCLTPVALINAVYCFSPCMHMKLINAVYCYSPCIHMKLINAVYCYSPCMHMKLINAVYCYSPCMHMKLINAVYCYSPYIHLKLLTDVERFRCLSEYVTGRLEFVRSYDPFSAQSPSSQKATSRKCAVWAASFLPLRSLCDNPESGNYRV